MLVTLTAAPARADEEYGPPGGPRIYLSKACHNNVGSLLCIPNIGCNLYDENAGSLVIARAAANTLANHGYRARIGTGSREQNIRNSNAFEAIIHIPIHSNAGRFDCGSTNPANGGTWVMHFGGPADEQLPNIMLQEIGPLSPGTSDRTLVRRDLGEITETRAHAAYLEAAFHTFGNDVAFLRNPASWAPRIAVAIDRCLGRNGRAKECTW